MPWDLNGRWIPESDSVANQLTGLLASDSKYMATARAAGQRTASRRGLLNSSIAAGAGESAAIAAAAPIASQDAQQIASRNQAVLEGGINLDNTLKVNKQQNEQALTMQGNEIASNEKMGLLSSETNLLQTQIAANTQLSGNYLDAFQSLANNANIPAVTRNAYITEFQRVMTQGQNLISVVRGTPLDWGPPSAPMPDYGGTPAPASGGKSDLLQTLASPISTKTGRGLLTQGLSSLL